MSNSNDIKTSEPSGLDDAICSTRSIFENWISSMPYEYDVARWSENDDSEWVGQYKDLRVELTWEAWNKARSLDDRSQYRTHYDWVKY